MEFIKITKDNADQVLTIGAILTPLFENSESEKDDINPKLIAELTKKVDEGCFLRVIAHPAFGQKYLNDDTTRYEPDELIESWWVATNKFKKQYSSLR